MNEDKHTRDAENLTANSSSVLSADTDSGSRSEQLIVGAVYDPQNPADFRGVIAAFAPLVRSPRNARLMVICDANHLAEVIERANHAKVIQHVYSVLCDSAGQQAFSNECDIVVSTSRYISPILLQVMGANIPVITMAVKLPEAIRHRRTALVVRAGDSEGLAGALLELAENADERSRLGSAASDSVQTRYSRSNLWRDYSSSAAGDQNTHVRNLLKAAVYRLAGERVARRGRPERAEIALTVDDGPDEVYTPQLLDTLHSLGVKATFFVVGNCAQAHPDLLARMAEEGHEIGNHSYTHPQFHRLSWRGAVDEIATTAVILRECAGRASTLFRPPHGKLCGRSILPALAAGHRVVMWTIDLKDYRARHADELRARCEATDFAPGDIVLYHGTNAAATAALPYVIEKILKDGRNAVTVSELLRG